MRVSTHMQIAQSAPDRAAGFDPDPIFWIIKIYGSADVLHRFFLSIVAN